MPIVVIFKKWFNWVKLKIAALLGTISVLHSSFSEIACFIC